MRDIVDRIIELQNDSGLDKKSFAERVGVSAASLSHVHTGRNNPSLELMLNIVKAYPDVSLDWLFLGKGGKFRVEVEVNTPVVSSSQEGFDDLPDLVEDEDAPVYNSMAEVNRLRVELEQEFANRLQVMRLLIEEHYKTEINFVKDLEEKNKQMKDEL